MTEAEKRARRRNFWIVVAVVALTFLPWLGETVFNTKGEPREAIVAYTMLQSGDWVLPVSYGGDLPYKPPFLAWCIAAVSWLFGGEVTHYTSRLPSALGCIALIVSTMVFLRRYGRSQKVAIFSAMLTMTAFEVWRAGTTCRVDMLLTCFTVTSIYALYAYFQGGRMRWLWIGVALISCGVLCKGPVGAVLPCLVIGLDRWLGGERFLKVLGGMSVIFVVSLIVPLWWYIAACQKGGEEFLQLVLEENVGRFTGTMSYDSHVHPFWYNFVLVASGWLPYTLLLFLTLFSLRYKALKRSNVITELRGARWWQRLRVAWQQAQPLTRLCLVATLSIFIFYCIPSSKRGVYLLPLYPFLSYFIAIYLRRMAKQGPRMVKLYGWIIAILAFLVPIAFSLVQHGVLSAGKALEGVVGSTVSILGGVAVWLSIGMAFTTITTLWKDSATKSLVMTVGCTIVVYWAVAGCYQPAVLNYRCDAVIADRLVQLYPNQQLYTITGDRLSRFYSVNYYMGDKLLRFESELPDSGLVLVPSKRADKFLAPYDSLYTFDIEYLDTHRSCEWKTPTAVYRFHRK
ncbi:MAG: glycosyltransferase family 39 protein [Bacteroidales bacterium]|nr:glycosyltransferase family 39 protein [Bacteroidales bacterium]